MDNVNNIILIGFMGTGKTSIGKILAKKLNWIFIDTDSLIENESGTTISEIFKTQGEAAFRDLETKILRRVLANTDQVISTGGGIVLRDENLQWMKEHGVIVCLTSIPEIIYKRTQAKTNRPVLGEKPSLAKIKELLEIRSEKYAKADFSVDTSRLSKDTVVQTILNFIKSC